MNQYYIHDSRKIRDLLAPSSIDLIITSPPYFDMKDYGSKDQIGYGQDYESYLKDIETVFEQCFYITKDSGSLWIIVDVLRKNGEIKLLPFDVTQKVKKSGWKLQDILIWKKDKTVPYTHKGEMRNIFEYIIFFTKSPHFKFYRERITSVNDVKEWWRSYPERYSPNGKSPTNIWEFPIPMQGSWGNKHIRHFCPLPEALIERIIHLCSDIGDFVLDPFAGSGTVLSAAYRLGRAYIGCDLNKSYRNKFLEYIQRVTPRDNANFVGKEDEIERFSKTIERLRILKFPKVLYQKLEKEFPDFAHRVTTILALPSLSAGKQDLPLNKFIICKYIFVLDGHYNIPESYVKALINKAPLSKLGIKATVVFIDQTSNTKSINSDINGMEFWRYDNGKTQEPGVHVGEIVNSFEKNKPCRVPPIYSNFNLVEQDLVY